MKTRMYTILGISYVIFAVCIIGFFSKLEFLDVAEVHPVKIHDNLVTKNIKPIPLSKKNLSKQEIKQLTCLATNMYHEAKGEGSLGWLAVGMVTMNRVLSERYPNTICEVVYQNNGKSYQFSWAGTKKRLTNPSQELYNTIEGYALLIFLYRDRLQDVTQGALFFHATYVSPYWSKKMNRTIQIGNHIFYTL